MRSRLLSFSRSRHSLWLWLLAAWLWLPFGVHAQDHIVERAWLEDASRQWQWQDVQKQQFQPYTGMLSRGFGHSVIWLKLRIDPGLRPASLQDPGRLMLRIRPVYLDDIRVFDPLAPQGLAGVTGDTHHPRLSDYQSLDFLLPITRGTQPRDIWLRLESTSTRQIDVQALNASDLNRVSHTQQLVFAGYVSVVLLFAAWGITYWLFSREHLIGAFGLMQVAALLYALGALGYWRTFWPQHWPATLLDQVTTVFSITAVSMAIFFHVLMIREFSPPPWVQQLHVGMLLLLPLKLAGVMVGWTVEALRVKIGWSKSIEKPTLKPSNGSKRAHLSPSSTLTLFVMRTNFFGACCSSMPADCSRNTKLAAEPSSTGTSSPLMSITRDRKSVV